MFPVALQLYSVREDLEKDFYGTLKKVKELGFDGVEFAGLYGHSTAEVKKWLEELELTAISAHVPFTDMLNDPAKILSDYAYIGCKYVAVPYVTEKYRAGGEKFAEFLDGVKMLGVHARDLGLTLLYHNHDFEFDKVDETYALDLIYDEIPAELLQTELDTCWVNVGGENPSDYIRKYSGRAPVVHLKDFVTKDGKPELRALGNGCQDFASILKAAKEAGSEWVVIEQDEPEADKTPLVCAEISIGYYKQQL